MLNHMVVFRAAMTRTPPHPSLVRDEAGPRDFVRIPPPKKVEAGAKQE